VLANDNNNVTFSGWKILKSRYSGENYTENIDQIWPGYEMNKYCSNHVFLYCVLKEIRVGPEVSKQNESNIDAPHLTKERT